MVIVAGRRSAELEATAELATGLEGKIRPIVADVTEAHQIEQLVGQICADHGGLDLAWNNAGALGSFDPIADISINDFDAIMAVNL